MMIIKTDHKFPTQPAIIKRLEEIPGEEGFKIEWFATSMYKSTVAVITGDYRANSFLALEFSLCKGCGDHTCTLDKCKHTCEKFKGFFRSP